MPKLTATDELRRLLDERGVEWGASDTYRLLVTSWSDASGHSWSFMEHRDGSFSKLTAYHLTPAQAIAATLGREPDDAAMAKLHDQMNAAMLKYEMAQGIEKRDEDGAIVVPWVLKMHALLEEAATLGSCNCSNSERTNGTCIPVLDSERDGMPYLNPRFVCSECGCQLTKSRLGKVWQNFCPNCGRRVVTDG